MAKSLLLPQMQDPKCRNNIYQSLKELILDECRYCKVHMLRIRGKKTCQRFIYFFLKRNKEKKRALYRTVNTIFRRIRKMLSKADLYSYQDLTAQGGGKLSGHIQCLENKSALPSQYYFRGKIQKIYENDFKS